MELSRNTNFLSAKGSSAGTPTRVDTVPGAVLGSMEIFEPVVCGKMIVSSKLKPDRRFVRSPLSRAGSPPNSPYLDRVSADKYSRVMSSSVGENANLSFNSLSTWTDFNGCERSRMTGLDGERKLFSVINELSHKAPVFLNTWPSSIVV